MKQAQSYLRTGLLWLSLLFVFEAAQADPRDAPPQGDPRAASHEHDRNATVRDGSRDFDFEFGEWTAKISRRLRPLSGSTEWVDYQGVSVVRKVWGGRANLGELQVANATGRIEGLSLRLYNPQTGQWNISWANSNDGVIGPPMVGSFHDGIGEFYNQELFEGRSVFVRFIFSDITPASFRLEQAFSADGGRSWEANWIASFER